MKAREREVSGRVGAGEYVGGQRRGKKAVRRRMDAIGQVGKCSGRCWGSTVCVGGQRRARRQ